jgi:hypothetical protein
VARLGKRVRVRLYERLVAGGVLRAEDDRAFGIFPRHRWPSKDAAHESTVRAGLLTALREGTTAEPRSGALVSLLLALKAVHKAVDPGSVGLSKKELNANAKRIAEGEWAAEAVRRAIDSMNAAVIAVAASAAAGSGGGSS